MAWAFVSGAVSTNDTDAHSKTATKSVTSGNLLVVGFAIGDGSSVPSISDGVNSWTAATASPTFDAANGAGVALWWAVAATTASITVTITCAATSFNGTSIAEYSGNAAASLGDGSTGTGNIPGSASTDGVKTGSLSTAVDGDLIISFINDDGGGITVQHFNAGTGYTRRNTASSDPPGSSQTAYAIEDQVQSAHGAINPSWTFANLTSNPSVGIGAAFKPAGGAAASPFIPYDYQLSQQKPRSVDFIKGSETRLIGKDKFFLGAGQAPTYDYPNPVGTTYLQLRYPVDLRTFTKSLNPLLLGKDVFYGGAGYGPDFDFPNPVGITYQQLRFPTHLRTHLNPVNQWLIGKDKFYGTAGYGPDFDYPNPLIARRDWSGWIQGTPLSLNTIIVAAPFKPIDWPNPFPPDPTLRPDWNVGTPLYLFGGGISPFNLTEWPVNRKVPALLQEFVESLNLQLTGGGKQPFNLSDWQNPNILRIGKLDWILGLDLNIVGGGIQPFSLGDWPNPLIKLPTPRGDVYLNELILQLLQPTPFAQLEWPNPVRIALREFGYTNADDFIRRSTSPSAPFSQNDWPNPRGYALVIDARTLVADLMQTTLRPAPPIQTSSSLVLIEGRLAKHVSGIIYVWV